MKLKNNQKGPKTRNQSSKFKCMTIIQPPVNSLSRENTDQENLRQEQGSIRKIKE